MSYIDVNTLARELLAAHASGESVAAPPSARDGGLDLAAAYAVEAEIARMRLADGHTPTGRKVGFANKAAWRIHKLETLVWAHMYDDTVHYASANEASHSLAHSRAPRIEPEIVLRLASPLEDGTADALAVLDAVEWIALGVEIVDCVYPDWQFRPADFVAALGLHAALIVGEPWPLEPGRLPALADALSRFTLKLFRNGQLVEEGSGRNALRSPALCLGELAGAIARQPGAVPLARGEIISSGSLTAAQPATAGETWQVQVHGLELPGLTVRLV